MAKKKNCEEGIDPEEIKKRIGDVWGLLDIIFWGMIICCWGAWTKKQEKKPVLPVYKIIPPNISPDDSMSELSEEEENLLPGGGPGPGPGGDDDPPKKPKVKVLVLPILEDKVIIPPRVMEGTKKFKVDKKEQEQKDPKLQPMPEVPQIKIPPPHDHLDMEPLQLIQPDQPQPQLLPEPIQIKIPLPHEHPVMEPLPLIKPGQP